MTDYCTLRAAFPTHDTIELLKRALLSSGEIGVRESIDVFSLNAGEISISRRNAFSLKEYKNPNVKTIAYASGDTVDDLLSRYKEL